MTSSPKVSVVLTSYNHAKYLRESIESVLHQTYKDFELIIWDDASTDDSWSIISSYADGRIRKFRNETNQFIEYFRRAISDVARGEYIAIHHSDDVWEAVKLEKQVAFLNENPQIGAVFSNALVIGDNGETFGDESHIYYKIFDQSNRTRYEWLNYFFCHGNALCHPSVLIRKSCYEDRGLYRYGLTQTPDFDMWVRLCLKYEIHVMPEKLVRFRVLANQENASASRQDNHIRSQFEYLQVLDNYRQISSYEEMVRIFPSAEKYYRTEGFDAQFVLGMLALETKPFKFTELFGLQLLFEALNNSSRAIKIKEIYHFDIQKFRELSGVHDIFSFAIREQQAKREQDWNAQLTNLQTQLNQIVNSNEWKIVLLFRQILVVLAPPNSYRAKALRQIELVLSLPLKKIRTNRRIKEDLSLIQSSGLFDEAWYLANNPDLTNKAKANPVRHYLLSGGFERRDPGPSFCSGWYLDTYNDVKISGINPLVHYLELGREEGRMAQSLDQVFDKLITQTEETKKERVVRTTLPTRTHELAPQVSQVRANGRDRFIRFYMRALQYYQQEGLRMLLYKGTQKIIGDKLLQTASLEQQYVPKVSIIIPVFNAVALTKACIESIYRETSSKVPFDVIVIDNASRDITPRYLKKEKRKRDHLNILRMKKNIGFGPAVNHGIQHSMGDFIVILNNDTMVSPGWLENLLAPLESDASIGIVSPVTNYVGEGPQIDERAKDLPPDVSAIVQHAKSIAGRSDVIYEPNRLVFFCVLIRRELVDMIGYLDESYEKGNFEDDDYCLRARVAGYKLAIAENSFVYHHGSVTFAKNRISHSKYMEGNRERFYRKAGRMATYYRHFTLPQPVRKDEVSVIIRTKDRPVLLKRALTSMANQTFKDFEIVLVNDGGEDVTNLLNSFGSQIQIKYVHYDVSKGRTAAVNVGIQHSRGKWISYLDDDDIAYPWHLETLFHAAQKSKAKFIYSDFNRALFLRELKVTTPDILQGSPPWDFSRRELLVQNYIPIHTWLHHRDCVEKAGLWDETFDRLEDYEFLLRLSKLYDFHHLKKVTCEYRYYLNSANSIYTDRFRTMAALEQIYQRNPVDDYDSRIRRQEILDVITVQIHKIEEIQEQIGNSVSEDKAIRDIIRLVTGL